MFAPLTVLTTWNADIANLIQFAVLFINICRKHVRGGFLQIIHEPKSSSGWSKFVKCPLKKLKHYLQ
jgi:hypothetical protein